MRALILIAAAGLALAACKNNDQVDNTQNVDENLTAENIVSNDVTAIDAVTGDAANMAAESDVNDVGAVNSNGGGNATEKPTARRPAAKPKAETTTSAASNAAGNAAE